MTRLDIIPLILVVLLIWIKAQHSLAQGTIQDAEWVVLPHWATI